MIARKPVWRPMARGGWVISLGPLMVEVYPRLGNMAAFVKCRDLDAIIDLRARSEDALKREAIRVLRKRVADMARALDRAPLTTRRTP